MSAPKQPTSRNGLVLAPGIRGAHRSRVRETYLRDHVAPMIAANQLGAVKVDLLLRTCGRIPAHLGNRPAEAVGMTYTHLRYGDIYDLVGDGALTSRDACRDWVRRQLVTLESRGRGGLVRRYEHDHRGHDVRVLSDTGDGSPLDDPDGAAPADRYITINGTLFAAGYIRQWSTAELVFYLAAMMGEANDRRPVAFSQRGDGSWWRSDAWFADADGSRRPDTHIRVPFSRSTLKRGRKLLAEAGLIQVEQLDRHPDTGRTFSRGGHRNYYLNRFESKARARLAELGRPVDPLPEQQLIEAWTNAEPRPLGSEAVPGLTE